MTNKLSINAQLGKRIRYLRKLKKESVFEFSINVGINYTYLSDLERGNRNPSLKILNKIANYLDISLEELFKGIRDYGVN